MLRRDPLAIFVIALLRLPLGAQDASVGVAVRGYELALGFRVNRLQLLKVGYEWLHTEGVTGGRDNVFGLRFVTSVHSLSRAIH